MNKTVEQLDQIVTGLTATLHRHLFGSGDGLPPADTCSVAQTIESLTRARARLCPYVDATEPSTEVQARD